MVASAESSGEEDFSGSMPVISLPMDNSHQNGNYHVISDCRLKSMISNPLSIPPPSPAVSGLSYIEHRVSRMDTLAGVAIRYGVEVSDIKRMNGLVTDLQMFAHNSLQIPLPGRHPPSPILSDDSATQEYDISLRTPPRYPRGDSYKDFQSLKPQQRNISAAMSNLQGYYGLAPHFRTGGNVEGTELAVYKICSNQLSANEALPWVGEGGECRVGKSQNSGIMSNGFIAENGQSTGDITMLEVLDLDRERSTDKSFRRRKADADLPPQTPELILKNESSCGLLARSARGLALRPKSASKSNLTDMDASDNANADPPGNSTLLNGYAGVRRSSSTSCMQESLDNSAISRSASKWTLKPDLQVLSAVAIPILDGLPISGKRSKAALD